MDIFLLTVKKKLALAALVNMLLTGPNIKDQCAEDKPLSHGAKTISQLIVFNSIRASKIMFHQPIGITETEKRQHQSILPQK